ncbi:hypothetical protein ACQ4LE_000123 [Meloidogyne hapla]|uniref:RING-type domain-containing protein n=1 Tax=Meloidogyne hapla TaxID=6305 RepID=A0A1I8B8C8_MELHA
MTAFCSICKLDVPSSLGVMKCCNHMSHTNCLKNFVAKRGRCPDCSEPATQNDVMPIVCDPPQQHPNNSQNEVGSPNRVREVLTAVMDRLKEYGTGSDQETAQVEQVGEAFESIIRDKEKKNLNNNSEKPSTSNDDEPSFKESGWDKLMRIVKSKEVRFIVLALILALLCIFFWEIAVSAGAFSQTTTFIRGALAALRAYAPELAVTLFAGIKAFFSFRKAIN